MHPLIPVSIFFVAMGLFFAGLGALLYGVARLKIGEAAKAEVELKERQYHHERARDQKT